MVVLVGAIALNVARSTKVGSTTGAALAVEADAAQPSKMKVAQASKVLLKRNILFLSF
jgi:hypothetical protein